MHNVPSLEELVEFAALLLAHVVDMDGDVVAEFGRDLFETQARGLGPEEVDHGEVDDAPTHDDKIVLPADVVDADGRRLQQDDGRGELAEQAETHADGADLGGENLADIQIHGGVAEGALEGEVEEDEKHARRVARVVGGPRVAGDHGAQARRRHEAAGYADHVH